MLLLVGPACGAGDAVAEVPLIRAKAGEVDVVGPTYPSEAIDLGFEGIPSV